MNSDLVYPIVDKFIKLINSEYSIDINMILVSLEEKRINSSLYYSIELLVEIKNYRHIFNFDVSGEEFINFNSIYRQVHTLIYEFMDEVGI